MSNNISIKYNDVEYSGGDNALLIANICVQIPRDEGAESLLIALAEHPSTKVRCLLAERDNLPLEAVMSLAETGNIEVRRALFESDAFRAWANTDLLLNWHEVDDQFALLLAQDLVAFKAADTEAIFKVLARHNDPDIRRALADSWLLPKELKELLFDDVDVSVRMTAELSWKHSRSI